MTTSTWTAFPNAVFPNAFFRNEGLRLILIVASLSTVVLAGQFAQSRGQDLSEAAQKRIVTAVALQQAHPVQHLTPTARYAKSQIQLFTDLLDGLTERAETILETTVVSNEAADQLKSSLRQLDEDLMGAREAYSRYVKSNDRFNEEELRETLMAIQDSASRAQGQLITLDQPDQGFRVSRTGQ